MRKILLFFISLFVGVGLLIWVVGFVGWGEIQSAFLIFSGWNGLIVLLLTFLMLMVGNWRWSEILKAQGNKISFFPLFRLYLAGFSLLFFAPMIIFGGETFRAYFLKEKYSIPWEKGMASVIADRIIELTIYILIILVGVIFLFLHQGLPSGQISMVLWGVLTFFTFGISIFYFKSFKKQSFLKFFAKIFNPKIDDETPFEAENEFIKFLKPKKPFFWKVIGLSFLKCSLVFIQIWFLLLCLGKVIGFLPTVSILSFFYLARIIPIPAALGTHEAFQALAFNGLGLGASFAPAFTMIERGAELAVALIGLMIFLRLGAGLILTVFFRRIENLSNNKKAPTLNGHFS